MIKLLPLLSEEFFDIAQQVNKDKHDWVNLSEPQTMPMAKKDEKLKFNLFDLVNDAYMTNLNMPHVGLQSVKDVFNNKYDYWEAIDIDELPDAEIVIFGTKRNGVKLSGIGHDGKPISKSILMKRKKELLRTRGYWQEASRRPAEILMASNVPRVTDFKIIHKLFPDSKIIQKFDDGSYIRINERGRTTDREYIFGIPIV